MSKELAPDGDMRDPMPKSLDFIPWMVHGDVRDPLAKVSFVCLKVPCRLCGVCLECGPPESPFTLDDFIVHYLNLITAHSSQMMLIKWIFLHFD